MYYSKSHPDDFRQTRWSLVLASRDGANEKRARRALEELCRIYWPPLYSFARRKGAAPHDAEDLTQSFFSRMLKKDFFSGADRAEGTMRSFLLTSFQNFMISSHQSEKAIKRGGRIVIVPIDSGIAEELHGAHAHSGCSPEAEFDKRWALAMLEKCLKQLEDEYTALGKTDLFSALLPYLELDGERAPATVIASQLGIAPGAVSQAGRRLRIRFSDVLTELVRQTLRSPSANEIDDERRALQRALSAR